MPAASPFGHCTPPHASVYMVGGAVRDAMLGLAVQDRDWVVTGTTPQAMVECGFVPVGRDFPVFLHPHTHEEYALARTERKTARGYRGFAVHSAPDVTIEQDLWRRDLSINAMARAADGTLVDPCGGAHDLQHKLLRHVSAAFVEDPVRILRTARLAARFADFEVAPQTLALMRQMVACGEADALVPERVWQEVARGLMQAAPRRMLHVLRQSTALARVLPEVDGLCASRTQHLLRTLDMAAQWQAPLRVRYACLCDGLSVEAVRAMNARLRPAGTCADMALLFARQRHAIGHSAALNTQDTLHVLQVCDALRQPERFADLLLACALGAHDAAHPSRTRLWQALQCVLRVDASAIAQEVQRRTASSAALAGPAIAQALAAARVQALECPHAPSEPPIPPRT